MNVINNAFEGQYARPIDHPVTAANPGVWKIIEMKIEVNPVRIWIRGEDSIWFCESSCWIGDRTELEDITVEHGPDYHGIGKVFEQIEETANLLDSKPTHARIVLMSVLLRLRKVFPHVDLGVAKQLYQTGRQLAETLQGA